MKTVKIKVVKKLIQYTYEDIKRLKKQGRIKVVEPEDCPDKRFHFRTEGLVLDEKLFLGHGVSSYNSLTLEDAVGFSPEEQSSLLPEIFIMHLNKSAKCTLRRSERAMKRIERNK